MKRPGATKTAPRIIAGIIALCESTATLLEVGIDNIQEHLLRMTDTCHRGC